MKQADNGSLAFLPQLDGANAWFVTQVVDHARFFLLVWLLVRWAPTTTDDNDDLVLDPLRTGFLHFAVIASHAVWEVVWSRILGPKTVSPFKRDQVIKDVTNPAQMLYLFSLSTFFGGVAAGCTYIGILQPTVVNDPTAHGWFNAMMYPYAEFWALTAIKDVVCMGFLHKLMHNRDWKILHSMHSYHHEFKQELNLINGANITLVDLFIENAVGPILFAACKAAVGLNPTVCAISFLATVSSEGSNHSCNPYSVAYYFPPLDAIMKGNIAHNLHHIRSDLNHTAVPWHHLFNGYQGDLDLYNKLLKTEVTMH